MVTIRPAEADDEMPVAAMIRRRAEWMRDRGLPGWEGWYARAESLASQVRKPAFPVWVMASDNGQIIACTSLFESCPAWAWTEEERAEPSIFLATTVTNPSYRTARPGALLAWWALDHAFRNGRTWVRRGVGPYPGLVRYYSEVQGWTLVRTVDRNDETWYFLQRRAEPQPQIHGLLAALADAFRGQGQREAAGSDAGV
ncbi:MAG: GNAT family N-acetyltransferase [Frankia sp.]|nr:GNAT family N-acetyltransferase [Frankia sp.]